MVYPEVEFALGMPKVDVGFPLLATVDENDGVFATFIGTVGGLLAVTNVASSRL